MSLAWWEAARGGVARELSDLLRKGAEIDDLDENGRTAAVWAVSREDIDCLKVLVGAGCDVDARDGADSSDGIGGWTLAMMAVNCDGGVAELEVLIKAGADLDAVAFEGLSATMAAAGRGNAEALRLLIASGADVEARAKDGRCALDEALAQGSPECVAALSEALARLEARRLEASLPAGAAPGRAAPRI